MKELFTLAVESIMKQKREEKKHDQGNEPIG